MTDRVLGLGRVVSRRVAVRREPELAGGVHKRQRLECGGVLELAGADVELQRACVVGARLSAFRSPS